MSHVIILSSSHPTLSACSVCCWRAKPTATGERREDLLPTHTRSSFSYISKPLSPPLPFRDCPLLLLLLLLLLLSPSILPTKLLIHRLRPR